MRGVFALVLLAGIGLSGVARADGDAPFAMSGRQADARQGRFGLGLVLGDPTGFVAKYWLSSSTAVDAGLAFSFGGFLLVYADYLVHFPLEAPSVPGKLHPYVGAGVMVLSNTETERSNAVLFTSSGNAGLAIRIPLGIEWMLKDTPLGTFVEVTPGIGFVPATFGFVGGGIGLRYYF
jgi:hypothetical protein